MTTRRSFLAGAATLAALVPRPASAAFGDQSITGTATIGVVGPFTGPDIRLGEQVANGVRQAVDDANRSRGLLDRTYVMRTFDDEDSLAAGLMSAQFAVDDPTVVAVIGHLGGKVTEGALRVYVNGRVPVIVPTSTFDRITTHGYGNVLRMATKDSTEGQLLGGYASAELKPKSAALLVQDGDYGYDVAAGAEQQLNGDKVAVKEVVFGWEKPDYKKAARAALDAKPDVVVLAGLVQDMGPVIPELRAAGYTGPFLASQGFFDQATVKKYGAQAEGLVVSTSMPPLALAPQILRIKNDFERRYGALTPLSAFGYAATQVAISAIRRAGSTDRLAVARALSLPLTYETLVGTFEFNPNGDPLQPNAYFYAVKDGNWKYVRAAHRTSFLIK